MSRSIEDITHDIHLIAPVGYLFDGWTQASIDELAGLIDEYFVHPEAGQHLDVWFRLFERFPESDGYETFWTILHGIERYPESGDMTAASIKRKPARFPVIMVNRMLNAGTRTAGGADLMDLLAQVGRTSSVPFEVRSDAASFLAYRQAKT